MRAGVGRVIPAWSAADLHALVEVSPPAHWSAGWNAPVQGPHSPEADADPADLPKRGRYSIQQLKQVKS